MKVHFYYWCLLLIDDRRTKGSAIESKVLQRRCFCRSLPMSAYPKVSSPLRFMTLLSLRFKRTRYNDRRKSMMQDAWMNHRLTRLTLYHGKAIRPSLGGATNPRNRFCRTMYHFPQYQCTSHCACCRSSDCFKKLKGALFSPHAFVRVGA